MKPLLLLILTISLSSPLYAYNSGAPSSDHSNTKARNAQLDAHEDTISTGQSSTRRDFEADRNYRMCKDANGSWLRPGDMGYTTCMDDPQMLRK